MLTRPWISVSRISRANSFGPYRLKPSTNQLDSYAVWEGGQHCHNQHAERHKPWRLVEIGFFYEIDGRARRTARMICLPSFNEKCIFAGRKVGIGRESLLPPRVGPGLSYPSSL
jgi:hypothetical protein